MSPAVELALTDESVALRAHMVSMSVAVELSLVDESVALRAHMVSKEARSLAIVDNFVVACW